MAAKAGLTLLSEMAETTVWSRLYAGPRVRPGVAMNLDVVETPTDQKTEPISVWRIGVAGGVVGLLCCVGPALLALLGIVSAGTAFVWATDLYDNHAWWFRLAGLLVLILLVWVALRSRRMCSVAGVKRLRWRLLAIIGVAVFTYAVLYAVTTWLGLLA